MYRVKYCFACAQNCIVYTENGRSCVGTVVTVVRKVILRGSGSLFDSEFIFDFDGIIILNFSTADFRTIEKNIIAELLKLYYICFAVIGIIILDLNIWKSATL